jgi:hypothetical protein
MKKIIIAVFVCCTVMILCCNRESPSATDAKVFYKEMISVTNEYADKLNDVKDSKSAASAISEYVDAQKKLIKKGRALKEKYPELALHDDPALKEYERSLEDSTKRLTVSISSAMKKFKAVEEFSKALQKFDEIEKEAEKE